MQTTKFINCTEVNLTRSANNDLHDTNNSSDSDDDNFAAPKNIFRYKFADNVVEAIHRFAKVHQFDDRKDYRENWEKWVKENSSLIADEEKRISNLGYNKCIIEKMYKAGRYYFRNKKMTKDVPVKRRKYIPISNEILQSMVSHIKKHIFDENYTPASGYDNFCETHKELLSLEITNIIKTNVITSSELACKIKKTYKNRHFIITHK